MEIDAVFDTVFNVMSSMDQAGFLLGALLMFLIAGAFLADMVIWHLKGQKVDAIIKDVRVKQKQQDPKKFSAESYTTVFEYSAPNGELIQALGSTSSNALDSRLPGKRIQIKIKPETPHLARRPGIWSVCFLLLFIGIGAVFVFVSLQFGEYSKYTFIMLAIFLGLFLIPLRKVIKPRAQWENVRGFQARKTQERQETIQNMETLDETEIRDRLLVIFRRRKKQAPILMLLGLVLLGGAAYFAQDISVLLQTGQKTSGIVTRIESDSGGDSVVYYSHVTYKTFAGEEVTFKDRIGSSTRMHSIGQDVDVIFQPDRPDKAIIDRGLMNFFPVYILSFLGIAIGWGGVSAFLKARRDQRDDRHPAFSGYF